MNSLSDPTPVRLLDNQIADLKELQTLTGVDLSKLIRLAVNAGIPELKRRFDLKASKALPVVSK